MLELYIYVALRDGNRVGPPLNHVNQTEHFPRTIESFFNQKNETQLVMVFKAGDVEISFLKMLNGKVLDYRTPTPTTIERVLKDPFIFPPHQSQAQAS